jgi:hypothetical protein
VIAEAWAVGSWRDVRGERHIVWVKPFEDRTAVYENSPESNRWELLASFPTVEAAVARAQGYLAAMQGIFQLREPEVPGTRTLAVMHGGEA